MVEIIVAVKVMPTVQVVTAMLDCVKAVPVNLPPALMLESVVLICVLMVFAPAQKKDVHVVVITHVIQEIVMSFSVKIVLYQR